MTTTEVEKANFDELVVSLKSVEDELAQRGTKFFGGKFFYSTINLFSIYKNDH
jgi:hypothetical protein